MRIALFGGSFDPPHRGHLAVAAAARDRLPLDQVWMAPAGVQPLKREGFATSYEDRLAMARLAAAGRPGIAASEIDGPRSEGKPNYTIDVLRAIKASLHPDDELFFLLGADAFLSLRQWHRAAELLFLANFIVAGRPGSLIDDLPAALPGGIHALRDAQGEATPGVVSWLLHNDAGEQSALYLMPDLHLDISATEIRAALAGEESAAGVLSPAVLRYIEERGLYR